MEALSPAPEIRSNLAYDFYQQAVHHPGRACLWVDGRSWCYGELATPIRRVAGWLRQRFPAGGENIGILANRTAEAYIGLLGALWSGNAYVPLNGKLPAPYLRSIMQRAELACVVTDPHTAPLLSPELFENLQPDILSPVVPLQSPQGLECFGPQELAAAPPLDTPVPVEPQQRAYILFTSGSTGMPKGVTPTVANVAHFLEATQARYRLTNEDRFSQFNDLTWDPSVFDLFSAWKVGASTHVVPAAQMLAPAHFIRKQQLSVWYSAPVQINLLAKMGQLKAGSLPSLRLSLFVGEPLLEEAAATWQAAAPNALVENVYGPTETTVVCLGQPYRDPPACITPERGFVAIGTPYAGMTVAIVDDRGVFLPAGTPGEIAISGPMVTPGYWRDPQLTAQRFPTLEHPDLGPTRWYLTGDMGYRDEAGTFHFLGRVDNQVQVHGIRIELEEAEHHLRTATGSQEVAVLGWPRNRGLVEGLAGFHTATDLSAAEIRSRLVRSVPRFLIPQKLVSLERFPRNVNGKIDRKALLALLEQQP